MIGAQTLKVKTFNRHLIARAHKTSGNKRSIISVLMLTSMVDMFSLLVIFLLQSFATSPELVMVSKNMVLPTAAQLQETKDAPVLAIGVDEITLDQKLVGKTQDLLKDPEPLLAKLASLREQWQKTHPDDEFKGEINIQAHRDISSHIISMFLAHLPSQAYSSAQLVVVAGGGR